MRHLVDAENCGHAHGTPVRDSHERLALAEAMMLVAHRLGELTRIVSRMRDGHE